MPATKDDVPARPVDDRDTACSDPPNHSSCKARSVDDRDRSNVPNRPPREVLDRLIDGVAWAKTCMIVTAATKPGSPERKGELEKLRQAVVDPRRVVDEIFSKGQSLPDAILVELRTCELAIPKLEAGAVLRRQEPPVSGDAS